MVNTVSIFPKQTVITVGATAVEVSGEPGNGKRISYAITNTSTGGQNITIAFGKEAVAGEGVVITPGQSWYESSDAKYDAFQGRITAISSAVGGTIAVMDRIE